MNMDSSLANWLREKLRCTPPEIKGSSELRENLEELLNGKCRSLMIEILEDDRNESYDFNVITCGTLSIQPKSRKVIRDSMEISLTPKEFDILYFLADNRGEIFTKEQIYKAVWEESYLLDDSNIMAFIRKLRKKIEPNPDAPQYIQTIWGIGYKFNDKL
ncbi:MAG: winged helix-turn-helix domain-containing protein [Anaerostipes sp.]|nr:winged helix-turn-helix domain-containing protein [Anaerostipes sp.]